MRHDSETVDQLHLATVRASLNEALGPRGLVPVEPDATKFTGMGRSFIWEAIKEGRLASVKVGKRRLIPREALIDFTLALQFGQAAA